MLLLQEGEQSSAVVAAVVGCPPLEPQLLRSGSVEGQQVLVLDHPVKEEGQHLFQLARIQEARWEAGS